MNQSSILEFFKKYDFQFFGAMASIFLIGIFNLYSGTHAANDPDVEGLYKTQLIWFGISMTVGFVISFIQPKNILKFSYVYYAAILLLLIAVLIFGHIGMGAQRWINLGFFKIQPSEFMKVALVLALARWFYSQDSVKELELKDCIIPGILAGVPAVLTIVQPDLGTGTLLLLIFSMICFYKRLRWKTIGFIAIFAVFSGTMMYKFVLRDYQKKRIITFVDPTSDARGSGYNALQSKIAIGSGKIFGKGFKKSSQASLNYLPENHTDFIFSIYNEEHGLFGALILISLYLFLLFKFVWLASNCNKFFDSIVVIGLMSILFWHAFINMSMVMGLMPVVGIPLPLMSYGGSSLLTFGMTCGIATSISNSRIMF